MLVSKKGSLDMLKDFSDTLMSIEFFVPDVLSEWTDGIDKEPRVSLLKRRAAMSPVILKSDKSRELNELASVGEWYTPFSGRMEA